jgi:glutathione synthase/RimK-type ligase-like ATP-grasp enzyme
LSDTPFLCHFVDKIQKKSEKKSSIDFRNFLTTKLKIFPENNRFPSRVLILSSAIDVEADIVGIELLRRGIDYLRLNIEDIPHSFNIFYTVTQNSEPLSLIKIGSSLISVSDISVVWLRNFDFALKSYDGRQLNSTFAFQQWNDALQTLYGLLKCPWINSLEGMHHSNSRVNQLLSAKNVGFNIPSTLITNDPNEASRFYHTCNENMIVKVLHHHDIETNGEMYSIYTHVLNHNDLLKFNDLVHAPCMLQERIHKTSELRVTVVDDKVFASEIKFDSGTQGGDVLHRYPMSQLHKRPVHLQKEFHSRCVRFIRLLGLKYGAIDFILDVNEKLYFLEVNPTGDWVWIERQTNLPITKALVDLIESTISSKSNSNSH